MLGAPSLCSTSRPSAGGVPPLRSKTADAYREFTKINSIPKRSLNTGRGWVLALMAHISCVLFWVLFQSLVLSPKIEPTPFILEIVSADFPPPAPEVEVPKELFEEIKLPEIVIPEIVIPEAIELPLPEELPEDSIPEPETTPPPPAKKISYEEFLKKHPKLKEKPKEKPKEPAKV